MEDLAPIHHKLEFHPVAALSVSIAWQKSSNSARVNMEILDY